MQTEGRMWLCNAVKTNTSRILYNVSLVDANIPLFLFMLECIEIYLIFRCFGWEKMNAYEILGRTLLQQRKCRTLWIIARSALL